MTHFGLLGFPLEHSFSARYFFEKFKKYNINADYQNFQFDRIDSALNELVRIEGLKGFNVTIPYKEKIIPYLDSISSEAAEIGAVNTVRVVLGNNNKRILKGYNTDIIGFMKSISPLLNVNVHQAALVLGTGGASKAVIKGLNKLGIETQLVSRHHRDKCLTYNEINSETIAKYKIIVNCTPLGMFPNVKSRPSIPYDFLSKNHILYDLVYNPLETEFLKQGKAMGCVTKNGLEMLHLQAEASWDIWTDR